MKKLDERPYLSGLSLSTEPLTEEEKKDGKNGNEKKKFDKN